jgi:hypothetical protein
MNENTPNLRMQLTRETAQLMRSLERRICAMYFHGVAAIVWYLNEVITTLSVQAGVII